MLSDIQNLERSINSSLTTAVKKSEIKIGDRLEGYIEVFEGIKEGEKIVAEGLKKVRPNGKINPILK